MPFSLLEALDVHPPLSFVDSGDYDRKDSRDGEADQGVAEEVLGGPGVGVEGEEGGEADDHGEEEAPEGVADPFEAAGIWDDSLRDLFCLGHEARDEGWGQVVGEGEVLPVELLEFLVFSTKNKDFFIR